MGQTEEADESDEPEETEETEEVKRWEEYEAGQDAMTRWFHRPDRCRGGNQWNDFRDDDHEVPRRVFDDGAREELSPDDRVVRFICGAQVSDIETTDMDPRFVHTTNSQDPRQTMATALEDEELSESRRHLYQATLAHKCWHATDWDGRIDVSYNMYLHCQEHATDLPSMEEVEAAMETLYGGHDFELANIRFAYDRALNDKERVLAEGAAFEEEYPTQKAVYYEAGKEAEETFAKRQETYGDIINMVAPITEHIFDGAPSDSIEDCSETAGEARARLAEKIGVESAEDLQELRSTHPVGYQITEALAHCYVEEGQLSKARVEAEALQAGTRRVTLGEEIRLTRQEALQEVVAEHDGEASYINEVIPYYRNRTAARMILPTETYSTPNYFHQINNAGLMADVVGGPDTGDDDDNGEFDEHVQYMQRRGYNVDLSSPITEEIEEVEAGARLVFVHKSETVTRQETECYETDHIESWTLDGDELVPNYRVECQFVGEPWQETVDHQVDPVVIPADQGEMLEAGMRVEILVNRHRSADEGDAVIRHAWPAGEDDADAVVVDGWSFQ